MTLFRLRIVNVVCIVLFHIFFLFSPLVSMAIESSPQSHQKVQSFLCEAKRCLDVVKATVSTSPEKLMTFNRALLFAEKAAEIEPDNPQVLATINELRSIRTRVISEGIVAARYLYMEKRVDSFIKAYQLVDKLLALDPDNKDALALRDQLLDKLNVEREKGPVATGQETEVSSFLDSLFGHCITRIRRCQWAEAERELEKMCRLASWYTVNADRRRGWELLPAFRLLEVASLCREAHEALESGKRCYGLDKAKGERNLIEAEGHFQDALSILTALHELLESDDVVEKLKEQENSFSWILQADYLTRRFLGVIMAGAVFSQTSNGFKLSLAKEAAVLLSRACAYARPAKPSGFKDRKAHYWLGRCLYALGHYKAALTAFDVSLSDLPQLPLLKGDDTHPDADTALLYRWKSWLRINIGYLILVLVASLLAGAGIIMGIKAAINFRQSPIPALSRGLRNQEKDYLPEAQEAYELALKQAELSNERLSLAIVLNCLGVVKVKQGKPAEGEKSFAKACDIFPTLPHPALNLAKIQATREEASQTAYHHLQRGYLAARIGRWSGLPHPDMMLLSSIHQAFPAESEERKIAEESEKNLRAG